MSKWYPNKRRIFPSVNVISFSKGQSAYGKFIVLFQVCRTQKWQQILAI